MTLAATGRASLLITLPQVAMLARVRRPVVTTWRNRRALPGAPFPEPVRVQRGQEHFDGGQIAAWLRLTGRGRNPDTAADLAAFASLTGSSVEDDAVTFAGLTALLCLRAAVAMPIGDLGRAGLVDVADDVDPGDEHLFSELGALGDRVTPLARYVDLLTDAAYNEREAFEAMMRGRFRLYLPGHTSTALSDSAREFAGRLAGQLATSAGWSATLLVDPTDGGSDLLISAVPHVAGGAPTVALGGTGPAARLARRRLRVHDVHQVPRALGRGALASLGAAVAVAAYPPPGNPSMGDLELLTELGDLVGGLGPDQYAVVLGPARALVGRLSDRGHDDERSACLRTGRVRAVALLGTGLVITKPRQPLAVWVLGPAPAGVAIADRVVMLADLSNVERSEAVIGDLIADILAAVGDRDSVLGRAFRFGRPALVRTLLAGRRGLVDSAASQRSVRSNLGSGPVLDAAALLDRLRAQPPEPPTFSAQPAGGGEVGSTTTLGLLLDAKAVHLLPGHRLGSIARQGGRGAAVLGPVELLGTVPVGDRRVDALDLATLPPGRYTEPGDVVFCTSPRPGAMVDAGGSSVVEFPARVLRVHRGTAPGLLPAVLAADINALGATAKAWRSWPVRQVPASEAQALAAALTELRSDREATRRRMADLDELAELLIAGTSGGVLAIDMTPDPRSSLTQRGH